MNYVVLLLAGHALKVRKNKQWARSAAASLAGSAGSVAVLLIMKSYILFQIVNILMIIPGMVWIAFGWAGWKEWLKRLILCYGITVLLGGLTAALDGRKGFSKIPFAGAFVGILLGELLLRYFYGMVRMQRNLFPLEIRIGEKKEICMGLLDTGNRLRVPGSGEPVHIVSNAVIQRLGFHIGDAAGTVGYRTVGSSDGILFIYRVDALQIRQRSGADKTDTKKAREYTERALIAGADEKMFEKKPYQVILNSDYAGG